MMRQRVQKLSQYQIMKPFSFIDLMYLAQSYEERSFTYKEYLYKEGQSPSEIYLIEQGEFQFTRLLEDKQENQVRTKVKQRLLRKKNISKQKMIPMDFQDPTLYNSVKPIKLKEFKVGIVVGSLGQSIGDEQIILNKEKRLYNAKCMSTTNKVILIKKQNILKILNDNQKLLQGIRAQFSQKQKVIHKAHKKLQSIRSNMENFVKLAQLEQTSRENVNLTLKSSNSTDRFETQFRLPSLDRKNQTQIRKKKQSLSYFNQQKLTVRMSNDSLLAKSKVQHKTTPMKTNSYQEIQQNSQTFALTQFNHQTSSLKSKLQDKIRLITKVNDSTSKFTEQNSNNYDDFITLKASKSWNVKQASPKKLLGKQKYAGMIDSSALVKEKQHILEIRRNTSDINERDQFQEKHRLLFKQAQLEKEKGRKTTTAHSKQYMEKMLLTALKKAGYQQTLPQLKQPATKKEQTSVTQSESHEKTQNPAPQYEEHYNLPSETRSFMAEKLALKLKKKRKDFFEQMSQVLQSNPFDQCYFRKLK